MQNGERTEEALDNEFTDEVDLEDDDEQQTADEDTGNGEDTDDDGDDDDAEHVPVNTESQAVVLRVEQPKTRKKERTTRRMRAKTQKAQDYEDVDQLIEELDPGASTRVYLTITRVEPRVFKGRRIGGYVDKIERHINTQEIKDLYGGGIYDLTFFAPKSNGRGNQMIRKKRIEITGDPILNLDNESRDGGRPSSSHDPDIVTQAMKTQQDAMDRIESKSREEKDTIMTLLANKGDDSKSNEIYMKMLEVQEKRAEAAQRAADAQIAAIREEARAAREEAARKEEKHREEMKEIRREMEDRKSSTGDTMINFLREQSGENMKRMELTMKSINEINKSNMEMMSTNHKMQTELLTNELKRVSDELKDTRQSQNKGDLVSEMKRMTTIQGLMKEIAGTGSEDKSLTDKLSDNLPEILESVPGILQGLGGLFRGQKVVQQAPSRVTGIGGAPATPRRLMPGTDHRAPLPPRRPPQPSSFPVGNESESDEQVGRPAAPFVPQQQQQPQPQPVEDQQAKIAQEIAKLKISFEESLVQGVEPGACYQTHIEGKYDEELLRKIAAMPTPAIIAFLQQNLDDDSPLFTVKGKDFLRKIHSIIKERFV